MRDTGVGEPGKFRCTFDADQYDTEIARAAADFDWEWPARRAARLLRERIEAEPDLLARWQCELGWTDSWSAERSSLKFVFVHRLRPGDGRDNPRIQFTMDIEVPYAPEVDDHAVTAAVDRVIDDLRTTDPKDTARFSGGSRAHAEALGYHWAPG